MNQIAVIAHNIRSTHNVGALLRTCDGLGIQSVYLTGYTPHPEIPNDPRLPHEITKTTKQIHKTALGAETSDFWQYYSDALTVISNLKYQGYTVAALEQTKNAAPLHTFQVPNKIALVLGREVEGIEPEIIEACDIAIEITMFGKKESFNVVHAASMALYHCRFYPFSNM